MRIYEKCVNSEHYGVCRSIPHSVISTSKKIEKSKIDFKGGRSDFRSFCDRFLSQKILARFKRKILLFVCECRTHSFLVFGEMCKCAFIKILLGKTQKVTKVTQYQFCQKPKLYLVPEQKKSRPGWKKNSLSKTEKKSRTKPLRGTLYPWLFLRFGKSSDQRDGFLFPCFYSRENIFFARFDLR